MKLVVLLLSISFLNFAFANTDDQTRYISQSYSSEVDGVQYEARLQQSLVESAPDLDLSSNTLPISFKKLEVSAREKLAKALKNTNGWLLYSISLNYLQYEKKWFYTVSFYKEGSSYSNRFTVLLTVDGKPGDIFEKTTRKL